MICSPLRPAPFLLMMLAFGPPAIAVGPPPRPGPLEGVWLFESATVKANSVVTRVCTSKLTIRGDSFALSKFMFQKADLKGKLVFVPSAGPEAIDLHIEEYDMSGFGPALKIPACTLPGIYRLEGGRLTVRFPYQSAAKRPADFDSPDDSMVLTTLVKAPKGFKDFPAKVKVRVSGSDGKPVAGAAVTRFLFSNHDPKRPDASRKWQVIGSTRTGADGTATVGYLDLVEQVVVRDEAGKRMAIVPLSPVGLSKGEVSVVLKPECRLTASVVCDELKKLGRPVGWVNVYVHRDGRRVESYDTTDGKIELLLPPGDYRLNVYGEKVGAKDVPVTVPEGKAEMTLDPIALPVSKLVLLEGRPAPELRGVVWRGRPSKPADLKGKYVLIDFWGYWCGPCIGAMPVLIELHEKFHDKGLVVIGVHCDVDGEVDTAAKLDEKIAGIRKKYWGDKDLPFANVLVRKEEKGGAADPVKDYGIRGYPTTVLIDREGKVVGEFHARDAKEAVKKIEELLSKKN